MRQEDPRLLILDRDVGADERSLDILGHALVEERELQPVEGLPVIERLANPDYGCQRQDLADLGERIEIVVHRLDALDLEGREPIGGLVRVLAFVLVLALLVLAEDPILVEIEQHLERGGPAERPIDELHALVDLGVLAE